MKVKRPAPSQYLGLTENGLSGCPHLTFLGPPHSHSARPPSHSLPSDTGTHTGLLAPQDVDEVQAYYCPLPRAAGTDHRHLDALKTTGVYSPAALQASTRKSRGPEARAPSEGRREESCLASPGVLGLWPPPRPRLVAPPSPLLPLSSQDLLPGVCLWPLLSPTKTLPAPVPTLTPRGLNSTLTWAKTL